MMDSSEFIGKAIIFSAPSGAGKTTIVKHLLKKNLNVVFSISACSRKKRPNETAGKDYYFISVDEFNTHIDKNEFIEWEEVYEDNFYGTLRSEINRIWNNKKHIIFDIDVEGGLNLKKHFGELALSVFVEPTSIEVLKSRLFHRDTEPKEIQIKRLEKAKKELGYKHMFDYVLLNNNLETACYEAENITRDFLTTQ